jgi:hypothetical protein
VATNCPQCRAEFENILVLNDAGDVLRKELVEKKEPPAGMFAQHVLRGDWVGHCQPRLVVGLIRHASAQSSIRTKLTSLMTTTTTTATCALRMTASMSM